jgi:hypothetical protein
MDDDDRNIPERVEPKNPLPDNSKDSATGDAGRDGYTHRRLRRPANSEIASSE